MRETPVSRGPVRAIASRPAFLCLLLGVATLLVYAPLFKAQFIGYDDPSVVYENPNVTRGLTLQGIGWAFTHSQIGHWDPLTTISHMTACQLFGLKSGYHHLINVLLHCTGAILLLIVLIQMTGARLRSAFVAALFALHPLRVESVAWVTERKDVLSGVFFMLTLWAYLRYVRGGDSRRAIRYLLVMTFFALGLMSKSMLVTLPFVLLLLDYWPLNRMTNLRAGVSLFIEKIPLFALSAAAGVAQILADREYIVSAGVLSLPVRIANAVFAYIAYIGKMICPIKLAIIYPYNLHPSFVQVGATALSLVLITAYVIILARRLPWLAVGWLWFLGTLVPVIGIIQSGALAMADRYTYIPVVGLFIVVAWGVNEILNATGIGVTARWLCAACVVAVLSTVTRMQLQYWQNTTALFAHAIENTADNDIAQTVLGVALANQHRYDEAIEHYSEALRIQPRSPKAWNNLGLSLVATHRMEEGINAYRNALHLEPAYAEAHNNLATALGQSGKMDEAVREFNESLRLKPDDAGAENNLAIILGRANRLDEAADHFSKAIRLDPQSAGTRFNLGNLYMNHGRPDDALAQYSEAIRLRPAFVDAHCNAALILQSQGNMADAVRHYKAALRVKPDHVPAMNSLAWIYATSSDASFQYSADAVRLAEAACKLTGYKEGDALDTLAAAYAAAGRFPDALRVANQALEVAISSGQVQMAGFIRNRIELYRSGRPYHEAAIAKKPAQETR